MAIRSRILYRLAILMALAYQPLFAATHWISVTTSHFEMYTTNSEKQAMRALQIFEQVRYFFLQNNRNKQAPEGRVRIIAFSSEQQYKPYRMNSGNFAFYLQSHERDYIVMQDIEPDHHQAAVHEYTHLIVQHTKMELPIWLNEGMADLYSSLEPKGQQALVGRPLESHMITLGTQPWMDWNVLFTVERDSPYYNQRDKMAVFYAQSWALTHMLALGANYGPRYPDFLATISSGISTPEALRKVYGKSVPEIAKDVQGYVRQTSVRGALYNISLQKSDLDPQVAELSEFQIGLALADLLASRKDTAPEARKRLLALEEQNPQSPDVEESLGYLAWQQKDVEEARKHFGLAVQHGSKDARMMYDDSNLEHSGGAPPQKVIDLMKGAVALEPGDVDFKILLAQLEAGANQYGPALGALADVHSVKPDQAFGFYSVSAYCLANLKSAAAAKASAEKALKYAKTLDQRAQIENLLRFLDDENKASAPRLTSSPGGTAIEADPVMPSNERREDARPRVQGQTKQFECGHGTFRLHVQVAGREMIFGISDPKDIVVTNIKDLEWSCGPLKPQNVTVIYTPASSATAGSKLDGTVNELVF